MDEYVSASSRRGAIGGVTRDQRGHRGGEHRVVRVSVETLRAKLPECIEIEERLPVVEQVRQPAQPRAQQVSKLDHIVPKLLQLTSVPTLLARCAIGAIPGKEVSLELLP
jgi:hypothetical protein